MKNVLNHIGLWEALTLFIASLVWPTGAAAAWRLVPGGYPTIQAAIDAAVAGDEIVLADGIYTGEGNKNIVIENKPVMVRSLWGDPRACIIDCESSGCGFSFGRDDGAGPTVQGLTIRNASAGAVSCLHSCPTLINCLFLGNRAGVGAGMYCADRAGPVLINCAFVGNTGTSYFGGVFACQDMSSALLVNCTITGNRGGWCGIAVWETSSHVTLVNCVLWGDECDPGCFAPEVKEICSDEGVVDVLYSDVEFGEPWFDTASIDLDPRFVRPPSDGGDGWGDDPSTPDIDEGANDDYGDVRLLPGSPCIDAGDGGAVPGAGFVDLGGHLRFVDDPATPNVSIVDMGAYEYQVAPPVCPGDCDCDGQIGYADVDYFVAAILNNQIAWLNLYAARHSGTWPPCLFDNCDVTGDGHVNFADIDPFVALIPSACP